MQFGDISHAMKVADKHLDGVARHVNSDGEEFNIFVNEGGWPSRLGSGAVHALNTAGWEFIGDFDAWVLTL